MAFGWEPGSGFWISPKATSAVPELAAVSQPIGVRSQHGAHVRVHPAPNTVTVSVALGGFPVENSRGPAPRGCACRGGGNLGTRLQPVLQPRARPTGEACPQVRSEGCVRPGPLPRRSWGGSEVRAQPPGQAAPAASGSQAGARPGLSDPALEGSFTKALSGPESEPSFPGSALKTLPSLAGAPFSVLLSPRPAAKLPTLPQPRSPTPTFLWDRGPPSCLQHPSAHLPTSALGSL